jgi:hypothetical protein
MAPRFILSPGGPIARAGCRRCVWRGWRPSAPPYGVTSVNGVPASVERGILSETSDTRWPDEGRASQDSRASAQDGQRSTVSWRPRSGPHSRRSKVRPRSIGTSGRKGGASPSFATPLPRRAGHIVGFVGNAVL